MDEVTRLTPRVSPHTYTPVKWTFFIFTLLPPSLLVHSFFFSYFLPNLTLLLILFFFLLNLHHSSSSHSSHLSVCWAEQIPVSLTARLFYLTNDRRLINANCALQVDYINRFFFELFNETHHAISCLKVKVFLLWISHCNRIFKAQLEPMT